jgi:hypothetical protein
MNEKARVLIETVMDMINGTLNHMAEDIWHCPASWVIENWWHTLNAALQVGDQFDSKANSLEATDHTESEKGHKHVQTDESFEV